MFFEITQSTLLKQSAVQNKISRAKSSFGKIGTSKKAYYIVVQLTRQGIIISQDSAPTHHAYMRTLIFNVK